MNVDIKIHYTGEVAIRAIYRWLIPCRALYMCARQRRRTGSSRNSEVVQFERARAKVNIVEAMIVSVDQLRMVASGWQPPARPGHWRAWRGVNTRGLDQCGAAAAVRSKRSVPRQCRIGLRRLHVSSCMAREQPSHRPNFECLPREDHSQEAARSGAGLALACDSRRLHQYRRGELTPRWPAKAVSGLPFRRHSSSIVRTPSSVQVPEGSESRVRIPHRRVQSSPAESITSALR